MTPEGGGVSKGQGMRKESISKGGTVGDVWLSEACCLTCTRDAGMPSAVDSLALAAPGRSTGITCAGYAIN